jgi:uncharacterized protein YneF (UPF0154 family)
MSAVMMIWILGGVLALLIGMMVVLSVARSLDGSKEEDRKNFAVTMTALATKATQHGQASAGTGWVSSAVAKSLSTLATASKSPDDDPETARATSDSRKQIKALFTGLAVAGGIIMLIVGIIKGDGS